MANIGAMKSAVASAITTAGMNRAAVVGSPGEDELFTGTIQSHHAATDNLNALHWARRVPGMADIGALFTITARGTNNIDFTPMRHIFRQ